MGSLFHIFGPRALKVSDPYFFGILHSHQECCTIPFAICISAKNLFHERRIQIIDGLEDFNGKGSKVLNLHGWFLGYG